MAPSNHSNAGHHLLMIVRLHDALESLLTACGALESALRDYGLGEHAHLQHARTDHHLCWVLEILHRHDEAIVAGRHTKPNAGVARSIALPLCALRSDDTEAFWGEGWHVPSLGDPGRTVAAAASIEPPSAGSDPSGRRRSRTGRTGTGPSRAGGTSSTRRLHPEGMTSAEKPLEFSESSKYRQYYSRISEYPAAQKRLSKVGPSIIYLKGIETLQM